jgi:hypothetical protein
MTWKELREKADTPGLKQLVDECQTYYEQSSPLWSLVKQWRREAAQIDSFHATMGTGYKVCANQLEDVLKG